MTKNYCDKMISVIVMSYNATLEQIYYTLSSIVRQEGVSYEIIIADDGSEKQYFTEIEQFFQKKQFNEYIIVESQENVGTVKNLLRALQFVRGKYIKDIGAGDCLYDKYTLKNIACCAEREDISIGFGRLQGFRKTIDGILEKHSWFAPRDIYPYTKNNSKLIIRNMLIYEDYISGASMFFEKEYLLDRLEELKESVVYCEDLIQIIAMLNGDEICFLDRVIVYYEFGTGISTKKIEDKTNLRMQQDHWKFNRYLQENYNLHSVKERIIRKNRIERWKWADIYFAFKNPFFYARKFINSRYVKLKKVDLSFLKLISKDVINIG